MAERINFPKAAIQAPRDKHEGTRRTVYDARQRGLGIDPRAARIGFVRGLALVAGLVLPACAHRVGRRAAGDARRKESHRRIGAALRIHRFDSLRQSLV